MTPPDRSRVAALVLRFLAILDITVWVWQGPVRVYLLGHRAPTAWGWGLYRTQAIHVCDVRYYERSDGEERYVRRWREFGYDAPSSMPRAQRVITPRTLRRQTRKLCRTLQARRGGAPLDLRVTVRCPAPTHWRMLEDRAVNVCDLEHLDELVARVNPQSVGTAEGR